MMELRFHRIQSGGQQTIFWKVLELLVSRWWSYLPSVLDDSLAGLEGSDMGFVVSIASVGSFHSLRDSM